MAAANLSNHRDRAKKMISLFFPDPYHVIVERREGVHPGTDIVIHNASDQDLSRDTACLVCELYDNNSTLHIESLKSCGLNGTVHLERLINFSETYRLSRITLEDGSRLVYTASDATDTRSISLKELLRLMTGQSWYEKFGFTNDAIEHYRDHIKRYIEQPIGTIYIDEIIDRIKEYASHIDPTIASDNTLDKMKAKSVSESVSYLYNYLIHVCPQRRCRPEVVMTIIDDIDDILHNMYEVMLSSLRLIDRAFIDLYLVLPRNIRFSLRKTQRNKNARAKSSNKKRPRTLTI